MSSLEFALRDRNYDGEDNDDLREEFIQYIERGDSVSIVRISGELYVQKERFHKSEYQNGLKANECDSHHLMETCGLYNKKLYLKYIPQALTIGEFFYQLSLMKSVKDVEKIIYSIFFQIVMGLASLNTKGFIHYDLNTGNVLIRELSQPATLTAFGFTYKVRYLVTIIDLDDHDRNPGYETHFLFYLETLISDLYWGTTFNPALKDIFMKLSGREPRVKDIQTDPMITVNFDHEEFMNYLHEKQNGVKKLNISFPPALLYFDMKETPLMWMEHRRPLTKQEIDEIKTNAFHDIFNSCRKQGMYIRMYGNFSEETGNFYHPLDKEVTQIGIDLELYDE